ncbi:hypothetical protein P3T25_006716 [Paraburkholderia sp. GAS32]
MLLAFFKKFLRVGGLGDSVHRYLHSSILRNVGIHFSRSTLSAWQVHAAFVSRSELRLNWRVIDCSLSPHSQAPKMSCTFRQVVGEAATRPSEVTKSASIRVRHPVPDPCYQDLVGPALRTEAYLSELFGHLPQTADVRSVLCLPGDARLANPASAYLQKALWTIVATAIDVTRSSRV